MCSFAQRRPHSLFVRARPAFTAGRQEESVTVDEVGSRKI